MMMENNFTLKSEVDERRPEWDPINPFENYNDIVHKPDPKYAIVVGREWGWGDIIFYGHESRAFCGAYIRLWI